MIDIRVRLSRDIRGVATPLRFQRIVVSTRQKSFYANSVVAWLNSPLSLSHLSGCRGANVFKVFAFPNARAAI